MCMYKFNKDLIHISVDSGKSAGKYAWLGQNGEIQHDVITTYLKEVALDDMFQGSADRVVYAHENEDNKAYLIGGSDCDIIFERSDTKLELKHEIGIYTAISKVLTSLDLDLSQTINIDLSINIPLEDFKDTETKNKYIEQYLNKEVSLQLNNIPIKFKISKLSPFYESQGALIRNMQLIDRESSNCLVCVIDIGSKNDTQILCNKLLPVPGKNVMTGNGINNSLRQLASKLYLEYKNKFTIPEVEQLLTNKTMPRGIVRERVEELFAPIALNLAKEIKVNTDQLELNTTNTKILFSGGSSIVLKEYLKSVYSPEYDVHFSQDARFDNAIGALIKALENSKDE